MSVNRMRIDMMWSMMRLFFARVQVRFVRDLHGAIGNFILDIYTSTLRRGQAEWVFSAVPDFARATPICSTNGRVANS
jgi:hypothetical protein